MSTMKALVKREAAEGLWLEDVPIPEIGINDVFIQVMRTAICGTDLHIYNWDAWARKTIPVPMVVGHEFVGEVVSVGENVNDFHPGEIVSGEGHVVCGRCRNCMAGRRHLCANTSGIGVNRQGAFAEYLSLPMSNVWVHRPGIPIVNMQVSAAYCGTFDLNEYVIDADLGYGYIFQPQSLRRFFFDQCLHRAHAGSLFEFYYGGYWLGIVKSSNPSYKN